MAEEIPPKEALKIREGLMQFCETNLKKKDNSRYLQRLDSADDVKDKDKENITLRYPDRFSGKLGDGYELDVQIAKDNPPMMLTLGESPKLYTELASVWISTDSGSEKSAVCYKLVKDEKGNEKWLIQESDNDPRYQKSIDTNFWKMGELRTAKKRELKNLQLHMEERENIKRQEQKTVRSQAAKAVKLD
jgi:hypothetical protein